MARCRNRDQMVAFYVTIEEKREIQSLADRADMSLSDYARKVLLGKMANNYGFSVLGENMEMKAEVGSIG